MGYQEPRRRRYEKNHFDICYHLGRLAWLEAWRFIWNYDSLFSEFRRELSRCGLRCYNQSAIFRLNFRPQEDVQETPLV